MKIITLWLDMEIWLEMNFGTSLPHTINVIVYAEFDNIVEINNNRNIQFDYTSWKQSR